MNSIAPIHESFFDLNRIDLSSKADGASTARAWLNIQAMQSMSKSSMALNIATHLSAKDTLRLEKLIAVHFMLLGTKHEDYDCSSSNAD